MKLSEHVKPAPRSKKGAPRPALSYRGARWNRARGAYRNAKQVPRP